MDPDQVLDDIMELASAILAGGLSADSQLDASEALANKINALNAWLTHGGYLPGAWANAKR